MDQETLLRPESELMPAVPVHVGDINHAFTGFNEAFSQDTMSTLPESHELAPETDERLVALIGLMNIVGSLSRSENAEHQAIANKLVGNIAVVQTVTNPNGQFADYLHHQRMVDDLHRWHTLDGNNGPDGIDPITGKKKKKKTLVTE